MACAAVSAWLDSLRLAKSIKLLSASSAELYLPMVLEPTGLEGIITIDGRSATLGPSVVNVSG